MLLPLHHCLPLLLYCYLLLPLVGHLILNIFVFFCHLANWSLHCSSMAIAGCFPSNVAVSLAKFWLWLSKSFLISPVFWSGHWPLTAQLHHFLLIAISRLLLFAIVINCCLLANALSSCWSQPSVIYKSIKGGEGGFTGDWHYMSLDKLFESVHICVYHM